MWSATPTSLPPFTFGMGFDLCHHVPTRGIVSFIGSVTRESVRTNAGQLERNVTLFLASQAISLFGSALVQLAITWYITLTTQSGSMMTISIVCGFLPTLFVSPFAGVWADRFDRKLLIVVADSLIALCTLILAILFFMGYDSVWLLFVASAIRSLGAGIQMPAVGAFLPQFVPQEMLTKVNAINGTIQSTMTLLSPMLSAALLTVASIEAIFFVDVVTAALAVTILLGFLRVPTHRPGPGDSLPTATSPTCARELPTSAGTITSRPFSSLMRSFSSSWVRWRF